MGEPNTLEYGGWPRPAKVTLRRLVGATTIVAVGVGGAIGSGIFRTPGELAVYFKSPWVILGLWLLAGLLTLMQSLVTAELATRFPLAGGEYQYLKHAYGRFAAFFFGWSFTVFIIACGAGSIAAALGDFAAKLSGLEAHRSASSLFGCAAIVLVISVNCIGLRAGAFTQNALTLLKTLAVIGIAAGAFYVSGRFLPSEPATVTTQSAATSMSPLAAFASFFQAMLLAFWPYTGATDPAKLAEETRDVHRAMPRALVTTVFILTGVYLTYNYALLCAMSPSDMAGRDDVHAVIFHGVTGAPVEALILLASILICIGSLSSVFLANTRVTFALARDGLTFSILARMSSRQAPTVSLIVCGAIACFFVLNRRFTEILNIYFMGSTVLFGLSYLSLIVFRLRDRKSGKGAPLTVYRMPFGIPTAGILVLIELGIAWSLVMGDIDTWNKPDVEPRYDTLLSLALLPLLAICYLAWPRRTGPASSQ